MTDDDLTLERPEALEISGEDLLARIEGGEVIQVMDVRSPAKVARERLDLVPQDRYRNIRGSELMHLSDPVRMGLDPAVPVIVICGHGKDSRALAFHLSQIGLDAKSLSGGLVEWMRMTVPRVLDPPEGLHRFMQFDRVGKGCLSYLLVSDGEAVVVDPPLRFSHLERALEEEAATLVAVADTHVHADYVSGAVDMARKYGVPYHLHPADAVFPFDATPGRIDFRPLTDGDRIKLGQTSLEVMHTPGHTEGSVTFLVEDRVALTGDFLFVESIGRPDLGGEEKEWAGRLWESVVRAIREWPDGLAIYPGHYTSEEERRMGRAVGAPFGEILRENEILQIQDPEVFLWTILERKAPFPEAYRRIKAMNLGLEPVVDQEVEALEVGRNECALGGA